MWKPLLVSVAISLGTGLLSALLTRGSMEAYQNMYRPPLSPPGWVFPLVWTILYVLMAIAAYLVYETDKEAKKHALALYASQLFVNATWSILFFNWNAYLLAFTWLLLLWYLVLCTAREFYAIRPLAGRLMVPYLIWLTFAAYLNFAIAIYYYA